MKLELPDASVRVLLELFRQLDGWGCRSVLVGGLVPPLLRQELDPEDSCLASNPRSTADCDVAIGIAVSRFGRWQEVESLLEALGFAKNKQSNQFRWDHSCGLRIDPMPVPAGIERGNPEAIAFAQSFGLRDTSTFFRGYELAIELFVEVTIELNDGTSHLLRIAGVAAMLSMKLQAWLDRRHLRPKDAQDICWLLRYLDPQIIATHLLDARGRRSELMDEVIERLELYYSDAEQDGVNDAHSRDLSEEIAVGHRNAIAGAVQQVLRAYRSG